MQIPYLARHCRVLTFDGRGNGRSDRPRAAATRAGVRRRRARRHGRDRDRAGGARRRSRSARSAALILAAEHPERVARRRLHRAGRARARRAAARASASPWDEELDTDEGWAKYNRHYWLRDYRGFLEFFFSQMFNEPHSTKPIEDCVGWALETTPETLDRDAATTTRSTRRGARTRRRVRCPVLVIQGTGDAITRPARGLRARRGTPAATLVLLEGSGHGPHVRDPVKCQPAGARLRPSR